MPNLSSGLTAAPAPPPEMGVRMGFWEDEEAGRREAGKNRETL